MGKRTPLVFTGNGIYPLPIFREYERIEKEGGVRIIGNDNANLSREFPAWKGGLLLVDDQPFSFSVVRLREKSGLTLVAYPRWPGVLKPPNRKPTEEIVVKHMLSQLPDVEFHIYKVATGALVCPVEPAVFDSSLAKHVFDRIVEEMPARGAFHILMLLRGHLFWFCKKAGRKDVYLVPAPSEELERFS